VAAPTITLDGQQTTITQLVSDHDNASSSTWLAPSGCIDCLLLFVVCWSVHFGGGMSIDASVL
jgi:hypothetical protein